MSFAESDVALAARLKALAHPARLAILKSLIARDETACCGDIVSALPLAQSTVSQHLKVLRDAGLIRGEIDGPRSCYCADREALAELAEALARLAAERSCACGVAA